MHTQAQSPTADKTKDKELLAIRGGPKRVIANGPKNFLHGPNEIGEEEITAVTEVLRGRGLFRFGKDQRTSPTARLEALFAEMTGARYVLAVNSGTSALIAGLIGIGVSRGDEVLVPAYTYIATAAAVLAVGAFPVIVEIDASLTMDPDDMEGKITPRTRAVMPVHMRGTPCNMARIGEIAKRRGIAILEDCAQANGGTFRGQALGTFGEAGEYSFQHYKIVTAGEGGMLVTNSKEVYDRAAVYHDSAYSFWMEALAGDSPEGRAWRASCFLGENFRQSELHGALGLEQLKKRDAIVARTRAIKRRLWEACEQIPGVKMEAVNDRAGDCGISLAFFMENPERAKAIAEMLRAEGVTCGTASSKQIPDRHIFYHWDYIMEKRTPHRNGFPWKSTDYPCQVEYSREMCPATAHWLERTVTMPITQIMSDEYVGEVCAAIAKVAKAC